MSRNLSEDIRLKEEYLFKYIGFFVVVVVVGVSFPFTQFNLIQFIGK